MTFILILFVIFIVWHFIPEAKPPGPEPKFRGDLRASADDANWRELVDAHCESPAETKFLEAMVQAFGLLPEIGTLRGGGLKLDLQVEEGRYRVDFMANEWLVIEIDGAAYHSSPEAQARDRARDIYFEGLGYSVLRIPAKTVFTDPDGAVKKVRSALAVGKRQIALPAPTSGFERLRETGNGFLRGLEEINNHVARQRAIDAALGQARKAASEEKVVVDCAIECAQRKLVTESRLHSDEAREHHRKAMAEIESYLPKTPSIKMKVSDFPGPPLQGNAIYAKDIEMAYDQLAANRARNLEEARQMIRSEPRLRPLVQEVLADLGCSEVLTRIA